MSIIKYAKLFVRTIENDKWLYEYEILSGMTKRHSFFGINDKFNIYFRIPMIRPLFIVLFPFILLFFVCWEGLKTSLQVLKLKRTILRSDTFFLATTNFSSSINNRINKQIGNACWILNTNIHSNSYIIKGNRYISCYRLISLFDVLKIGLGSILSYVFICKQYGVFYMLESINSYRWLLYYRACQRIPIESSIFFINHKDRWAFLDDHINCKTKTLIQHGTEIIKCKRESDLLRNMIELPNGGFVQNMPNKYKTLTHVIALSEKEVQALKSSIIESNPEFKIGGYGFETYPLESNKYSVLIIAHSGIYLDKEINIIQNLQDFPIDLYVKNHPTQNNDVYVKLLTKYRFTLITEQKFPHVDVVITYDSTLAHEYSSVGIKVIYHTQHNIEEIRKYIQYN